MNALILTAGFGTRLKPVTDLFPKPVVPFLNIPLMYYSVGILNDLPIDTLVFNTHYKPEQVESAARTIPGFSGRIQISNEPDQPLGGGGAIKKAWSFLRPENGEENFFVINGDEVILPHDPMLLRHLMAFHEKENALATLLVMHHPLVGSQFGGVWANQDHLVFGFGKSLDYMTPATSPSETSDHHRSPIKPWHFVGLVLLNTRVSQYLPEGESNLLYDVLAKAGQNGERIQSYPADLTWYETGNIKDYLQASKSAMDLLSSQSPPAIHLQKLTNRFWSLGTKFISPQSERHLPRNSTNEEHSHGQLSGPAIIGSNCQIDTSAVFEGFAVIGDSCTIGANTKIQNSVLLPHSLVSPSSLITNSFGRYGHTFGT